MNGIILTKSDGIIIGNIAKLLGLIMNGIFNLVDLVGIHNIGLTIILFTIVVNLLMMPLTLKQQKFSKLSARISHEIKAIQAKYKNRKDTESAMMQNQEIQAVYAKYGVSPSGSCLQLLIQMPILFALYRVIYAIPAYVTKIKDTFAVLAEKIINSNGGVESFKALNEGNIANTIASYGGNLVEGNELNGVIDVLNKLSSSDMAIVAEKYGLANLEYEGRLILGDGGLLNEFNSFFGLNIANSPKDIIAAGGLMFIIGGLMFPLLSALTQWINTKLIPHSADDDDNPMASSMKTMNIVMPLMSAWFCYMLPCGMGLYWIAGSVVRSIQQVAINKHFDKMDFEDIIKQNESKSKKKLEKLQKQQEMMNAYASMKTKSIQSKADIGNNRVYTSNNDTDSSATSNTTKTYKPGSMMAKANMVKEFNEKNNKN